MAQISLESSDSNDDQLSELDFSAMEHSLPEIEKLRCHLVERIQEIVNRLRT